MIFPTTEFVPPTTNFSHRSSPQRIGRGYAGRKRHRLPTRKSPAPTRRRVPRIGYNTNSGLFHRSSAPLECIEEQVTSFSVHGWPQNIRIREQAVPSIIHARQTLAHIAVLSEMALLYFIRPTKGDFAQHNSTGCMQPHRSGQGRRSTQAHWRHYSEVWRRPRERTQHLRSSSRLSSCTHAVSFRCWGRNPREPNGRWFRALHGGTGANPISCPLPSHTDFLLRSWLNSVRQQFET